MGRVEWREADEPVHAALSFKHSVRVATTHEKRDGLQSRFFAGRLVNDLRLEALGFGPTQVHAREHLRPVGRIHASGPGKDADDGAVRVELAVEIRGHFELVDGRRRRRDGEIDFGRRGFVRTEQLEHLARLFEAARDAVHAIDFFSNVRERFHRSLGRVGIVPEAFGPRALVEFGYLAPFSCVVKDAP